MKDLERLKRIYSKTDGYCHLCHGKLSFHNHGKHGMKGAWHVEHSVAKANGGSSHMNNLFPACISCNIIKNTKHTRTIRRTNGVSRAPYSKQKKKRHQNIQYTYRCSRRSFTWFIFRTSRNFLWRHHRSNIRR